MKNKLNTENLVFCLVVIIGGIATIIYGPVPIYGQEIPNGLGFVFIGVGIWLFLETILSRKQYQRLQNAKMLCAGCGQVYDKPDVKVPICPKCNGKLNEMNQETET